MMQNPLYARLRLRMPSREGIANSLFGQRRVSIALPQRQANVNQIFGAAVDVRAALDRGYGGYTDYPPYVLGMGVSGLGYLGQLGALPEPKALLGTDQDGLWTLNNPDGLGPGNPYVVDFKGRYAWAQGLSAAADEFKPGTPIRALQAKLDARLTRDIVGTKTAFRWDEAFGRSANATATLNSMLKQVNEDLTAYSQLELALHKAPATDRLDYVAIGPDAGGRGDASSQGIIDRTFDYQRRGDYAQRRGASTAGGMPSWALPVAGVALLGVLAGGLYFLSK